MIKIPLRVWILIICLVLALLAINPSPGKKGIEIKSVEAGGVLANQGITAGQIVKFVNNEKIESVADFERVMSLLENMPQAITVETEKGRFSYNITNNPGFEIDENITVISTEDFSPLQIGEKVKKINSDNVSDKKSFDTILDKILPQKKLVLLTDKGEFAMLVRGRPIITVGQPESSNLVLGLDLRGGTRVLLRPVAEEGQEVEEKDIGDIISVLINRLNVYGLSDMRIRSSTDWAGNKFILIEIAGISREEVRDLISKQGKFEAKIGNKTVFVGGKKDITFVCRGDGSCSGIRQCNPLDQNNWGCKFEFAISLSQEAAKQHAEATKDIDVILSEDGREILKERIDFYLDGKKVDSLQISADLKGVEATSIAISGPGTGITKADAADAAIKNMDKLQTILITGSLPFKLKVEKLDTISPTIGRGFIKNALLIGVIAIIVVALILTIRYKSLKITVPVILTSLFEVFLVLGFAALVGWNLDTVSIAGIIASVGTGVDDQIIIIDEAIKGKSRSYTSWRQRIKKAFFVIMAAYVTLVVAMLPLWNAGAGLLRGFAVTTIVGVTMGVFITRPAFAAIVGKLVQE